MQTLQLFFAGKSHAIQFPDNVKLAVSTPENLPVIKDEAKAINDAILQPIGCPRLTDFVKPSDKIAIVVTDITRKIPDDLIVGSVLDELRKAGVPDSSIKIIIGTGLHRPNTPEEIKEMLGEEVPACIEVINHVATDASQNVNLGLSRRGVPMILNRHVVEADIRIATGTIEPHKLAGFSGGVKTMSVGAAGKESIDVTHSLETTEHPSCRLGVVEGNIFREFLNEVASSVRLDFIINVIQNGTKNLVGVVAGHAQQAFIEGVEIARRQCITKIDEKADMIIAVPGYPKERDVYQASRAMNTIIFGPEPIVNQNGTLIVPAPCQDGFGHPDVYNFLVKFKTPEDLLTYVKQNGVPSGGSRVAYKLASILQTADIYYTDCLVEEHIFKEMHLKSTPTLQQAVDEVITQKCPDKILIMPFATTTLPVLSDGGGK